MTSESPKANFVKHLSGAAKRRKKALVEQEAKKLKGSLDKFLSTNKKSTEKGLENTLSANNEQSGTLNPDKCGNLSRTTIGEQACCDANVVSSDLDFNVDSIVKTEPIPSNDPAFWVKENVDKLQEYFCQNKPNQNIDLLHTSMRLIAGKERKLSLKCFFREKQNNESVSRDWLLYSPSKCALYCFTCKLFTNSDQALCNVGFTDWKNVTQRLSQHEKSAVHREAVCLYSNRCNASTRVDITLIQECQLECKYWQNVLRRVVAVIKHLCQHGLPIFGSDETLHSLQNGNFLGTLELVSIFDPFLAEHLEKYSNPGSGKTNYLSSTIVNELIEVMANSVLQKILLDVAAAKYFGIIVDSTPDLTHIDQLSVIVRYVDVHGVPVEHFLKFQPIHSHTSSTLCDTILSIFSTLNIDVKNCRGQSYDNASNMSGKYTGLQARIKEICPTAEYVPCAAHSLNLVGSVAVECCNQAVTFFGFVQSLYNFFSASTHRWEILTRKLLEIPEGGLSLKNLSCTRWSASADAVKALKRGYDQIADALEFISEDNEEKDSTRHEARSLLSKMKRLETAILIFVWDTILQRMNKVSKTLQGPSCSLTVVVPLYESLIKFIQEVRNNFHIYESDAQHLLGYNTTYTSKRKTKVAKSRMLDESLSEETQFDDRESFIFRCYYVLCDSLLAELKKRQQAYSSLDETFGFLYKEFNDDTKDEIYFAAKEFQMKYSDDIDDDFPDEFVQFKHFQNDTDPEMQLKALKKLKIEHTFPNVDTAFRVFLSMPISNASSERSFSALKRIKNYLRCNLSQQKLNNLSLLAVENDITSKLDFEDVIFNFAQKKSRRKPL